MDGLEEVILVDAFDRPCGTAGKLAAHQDGGRRHRAFSVFVVNPHGHWLLQLRSRAKYHFGGLWTNACCSHPRPGETVEQAVHRRLQEELGFDCEVTPRFVFSYRSDCASGLTEWECDHVFTACHDGPVSPNPCEVERCEWRLPADVMQALDKQPETFTPWFRIAARRVMAILARDRGNVPAGRGPAAP